MNLAMRRCRPESRMRPSGAVGEPASVKSALAPNIGATIDHIAKSLVEHAAPVVQADHAFQARVGAAAGTAAAQHVAAPVWIAAGAVTVAAAAVLWKTLG